MKTFITTTSLILLFAGASIGQETEKEKIDLGLKVVEQADSIVIIHDEDDSIYEDFLKDDDFNKKRPNIQSDTTTIRFGKKRIVIVERDGSTSIETDDRKYNFDEDEGPSFTYKAHPRFIGHWAGIEWGFNGFITPDYSLNMTDENKYLELRQGRSWNFNVNFLQYSLGFGSDKIGLVTGLGFEFNNYHFRNPITLKVVDGITVPDSSYLLDPKMNVTKSKLSTIHFTVPLLMEFQIPTGTRGHRVFISAGVIGGVKIESHTKIVFDGATKGKDKVRNDFNLATFRYGVTARVGYRALKVFANYYPTQLFEKGKGPEVCPFTIGLVLLSFR